VRDHEARAAGAGGQLERAAYGDRFARLEQNRVPAAAIVDRIGSRAVFALRAAFSAARQLDRQVIASRRRERRTPHGFHRDAPIVETLPVADGGDPLGRNEGDDRHHGEVGAVARREAP
jgi:hypothetical protein